jgi:transcriptional regulator with XRE-family HTH domain
LAQIRWILPEEGDFRSLQDLECYNIDKDKVTMSANPELATIRSKKIGLLILDARKAADKEIVDCAKALGITPGRYRSYESGKISPTLCEIEALAYFFNIPVEHFWNPAGTLYKNPDEEAKSIHQFLQVRNRVVAAQLRLIRDGSHASLKSLSATTGIPSARIGRYERGEIPIPLTDLEPLAAALSTPLETFYVSHGRYGHWRESKGMVDQFQELPIEIQQFVVKPINMPYMELAMKLSQTSVEKLRGIAENILDITF